MTETSKSPDPVESTSAVGHHLSPASLKILSTVKPELQKVVLRAAEVCPVPFAVVSGNRTAAEQRALYAKGRTAPGPKVTWTLNSNHMGARAIDFSLVDAKGQPTNGDPRTWPDAKKTYKPVADAMIKAGKELGTEVEWGYYMWGKDFGHIQLKKGSRH